MKLIIDIPEDVYEDVKATYSGDDVLYCNVKYGTPLNGVLDKIKAEIDDLDLHYDNDYFSSNKDAMFKCDEVMQIIDKYRGDRHET